MMGLVVWEMPGQGAQSGQAGHKGAWKMGKFQPPPQNGGGGL